MRQCTEQQEYLEPLSAPVAEGGFIGCVEYKQTFIFAQYIKENQANKPFQQNLSPDPAQTTPSIDEEQMWCFII